MESSAVLETNLYFFTKFVEVYEKNRSLKEKLMILHKERNELKHLIERLDRKNKSKSNAMSMVDDLYIKKKRIRRGKKEIIRVYVCKYPQCMKKYGTEGSLNQHIKIKHNEQYYSNEKI